MGLLRALAGFLRPGGRDIAEKEPAREPEPAPGAEKEQETQPGGTGEKEAEAPAGKEMKEQNAGQEEKNRPDISPGNEVSIGETSRESSSQSVFQFELSEPSQQLLKDLKPGSEKEAQVIDSLYAPGDHAVPENEKNLDDVIRSAETEVSLDRASRQLARLAEKSGGRMVFINKDGQKLEYREHFNPKTKKHGPVAFIDGKMLKKSRDAARFIKKILVPGAVPGQKATPRMGNKDARAMAEMAEKYPNTFDRYSDRGALKALERINAAKQALMRNGADERQVASVEKVMKNIMRTHPSEEFRRNAILIDKTLIRYIDSPSEELVRIAGQSGPGASSVKGPDAGPEKGPGTAAEGADRSDRLFVFYEKTPGMEGRAAEYGIMKDAGLDPENAREKAALCVVSPARDGNFEVRRYMLAEEQRMEEQRAEQEREREEERQEEERREEERENGGDREEEALYRFTTAAVIQVVTLDHIAGMVAQELGAEQALEAGMKGKEMEDLIPGR